MQFLFQYFMDRKKIPDMTLLLLFPASVLESNNTIPSLPAESLSWIHPQISRTGSPFRSRLLLFPTLLSECNNTNPSQYLNMT